MMLEWLWTKVVMCQKLKRGFMCATILHSCTTLLCKKGQGHMYREYIVPDVFYDCHIVNL
jgi:hypothetical protein